MKTIAIAPIGQFRLRLNQLAYTKPIVDKQQVMQMILATIADLDLQNWFITNHDLAAHFGVNTGSKIYVSCPEEAGTIEVRGFVVQFVNQRTSACAGSRHLLQLLDVVSLFKYMEAGVLVCFVDRYLEMLRCLERGEIECLSDHVLAYPHFTRSVVARALGLLGRADLALRIMESFIPATYRKYRLRFPFFFEEVQNA
ncbi:hypothetical protein ACTJIJ_23775 [Niabella sp. 22666]|uniref:hypothetical protein n=1 Tax=Niabella sp. 22666 TaxID=3453954 RepID=UPI003F875D90